MTDTADDATLVAQVLDGQVEAYGPLVERYRGRFGRYAVGLCGDPDLAADAMQEAFIRAFERLAACRKPAEFGSWFFRILTNQCHNHRERRGRQHLALVDVHEAPERTDGGLTRGEIRRAIYDAMGGLTADLRDAFLLRDIEDRSYAEIATLLEASESAIRQRVKRARDHMRRALEEFA